MPLARPEWLQSRSPEGGQSLIMFAVLAPIMFAIMGLAIQGGMTFLEYRHMQAAADVAALMGAQDLPNNASQAISDACQFSQTNGYDDCTSGGASTTTVCVPPQSQSPYNGLNYGGGNSNCSNAGTGKYYYIEVQIQKQVSMFPIFGQYLGLGGFNLYAHAIARNGQPSPTDYAIAILDKTQKNALTLSGNKGVIVVGPSISNSTDPTSINTSGSADQIGCNGEWLTAASETLPNHLQTQTTNGTRISFSPPDCLPLQNWDNPVDFLPDQSQIPDPYCVSMSPPIGASGVPTSQDCNKNPNTVSSMSNCVPCNSPGYYYTWDPSKGRNSGTWGSGGSNPTDLQINDNKSWELFPGTYKDIKITNTSSKIYLNPGVYTIEGTTGIDASGGNMCIYGAPVCDIGIDVSRNIPGTSTTCSSADMSDNTNAQYAPPKVWYYYCSPWGIWDSNPCLGSNNASCTESNNLCGSITCPRQVATTPPTFLPPAGVSGPATPLNGVTFYVSNGGSFKLNGTSFMDIAFPNPCPGTGTLTAENTATTPITQGTVPFVNTLDPTATSGQYYPEPSGAVTGEPYVYPSGSLPQQDGISNLQSPSNSFIYPDAEFTLHGECERYDTPTYAGDVWQGEMPAPAGYPGLHVHFLVFARNPDPTISAKDGLTLNGNGQQNWWGILYDPGSQGCGNTCQVTLTGCSGSATNCGNSSPPTGPPMVIGQLVADNAVVSGTATMEVYYRPCDPTTESCGTGPGSGLVQ